MTILRLPLRIVRAAAARLLRLGRRVVQLGAVLAVAVALFFVLDALLLRDTERPDA